MQLTELLPKIHPLIIGDDDIEMTIPVRVPSYEKIARAEQLAVGLRMSAAQQDERNEAQADVSYWRTLRLLLEAGEAISSWDDELPYVDLPDTSDSVLIERCALVEEWAAEVKRQADEIKAEREGSSDAAAE